MTRLSIMGEAVLHLKPDGGTEWLWGYFRAPRAVSDVRGLEIELQDHSPRFRLLATDAVHVCPYRETRFQGQDSGSRLVIRGQEYGVRDKHITDIGEAVLELSSDCCPSSHPLNPPQYMAAVQAANSDCPAPCEPCSVKTDAETSVYPPDCHYRTL